MPHFLPSMFFVVFMCLCVTGNIADSAADDVVARESRDICMVCQNKLSIWSCMDSSLVPELIHILCSPFALDCYRECFRKEWQFASVTCSYPQEYVAFQKLCLEGPHREVIFQKLRYCETMLVHESSSTYCWAVHKYNLCRLSAVGPCTSEAQYFFIEVVRYESRTIYKKCY